MSFNTNFLKNIKNFVFIRPFSEVSNVFIEKMEFCYNTLYAKKEHF